MRNKAFVFFISALIPFFSLSQEKEKNNSLLNKINPKSQGTDIGNILNDKKDEILEKQIDLLLKEIQKNNKDFEDNLSK